MRRAAVFVLPRIPVIKVTVIKVIKDFQRKVVVKRVKNHHFFAHFPFFYYLCLKN